LVLPEHAGLRLDQFLAASTSWSRRAARRALSDGAVARNGRPTRVQGRVVELGDVIDVINEASELGVAARPELPEVATLHHDRWLLAVDKPPGILSQPGSRPTNELALDQLVLLRLALEEGSRPYLRMVHRLDRPTTGVALFARNPQAHTPLVRAWSEGTVDRRYLAVVEGEPELEAAVIDDPIARDPDHDWRFRVASNGRPATTEIRVRSVVGDGLTVVECRPRTGRTHQVRVHLAHWGHPVLGDRLYGSRRSGLVPRPLLHASVLALPHPKDGGMVRIEAPIPEDMLRFVGQATEP
jgi:RluA family pseudouridine synthase